MQFLDSIQYPKDLKQLSVIELRELCQEIRDYFTGTILHSGGHFAANLGVVELTVAMHYVFDFETDRLVWDVGHQAYIHKLLTGRKNELSKIRTFYGISGFPKRSESHWDHFGTGHSSTGLSAALGMAVAAALKGESKRKMIAVVGDGALTGGMTFEALNNIVSTNPNLLFILNDNHIGIDPHTGAIDTHLQNLKSGDDNIFRNFGLPYFGPEDGHDLENLIGLLRQSQSETGPQVLHIKTVKGKGYAPAEAEQTRWHSTNKFVKIDPAAPKQKKWQDVFAETIIKLAEQFPQVVGITPAMPSGSGMIRAMERFPDRFFDVGIAEQHAVTFAAGMACEGCVPMLNIYSTFLQRGYDQLIHDVALQQLPVVFCIDRAGLVGEDGPTHHGSFDIAFLNCIPGIVITAPRNEAEFSDLLYTAVQSGKPFAVRYPKGEVPGAGTNKEFVSVVPQAIKVKEGQGIAIVSTGIASNLAEAAIEQSGFEAALFHFPFVKPLDTETILSDIFNFQTIITVEDGCVQGGFGQSVASVLMQHSYRGNVIHLGIPDAFATHGDNHILYETCGYSEGNIATLIQQIAGKSGE